MSDDADDKVGYGRPPRATRLQTRAERESEGPTKGKRGLKSQSPILRVEERLRNADGRKIPWTEAICRTP